MAKRWKRQEITYRKRYAKVRVLNELTEGVNASPEEVIKQLKLLQVGTKDGHGYIERPPDPLVKVYERGLKGLHQGKCGQMVADWALMSLSQPRGDNS